MEKIGINNQMEKTINENKELKNDNNNIINATEDLNSIQQKEQQGLCNISTH